MKSFVQLNSTKINLGLLDFVILIMNKNPWYFRNKEIGYICSSRRRNLVISAKRGIHAI